MQPSVNFCWPTRPRRSGRLDAHGAQTIEANLIFSGHENRGKTCNYAVHRARCRHAVEIDTVTRVVLEIRVEKVLIEKGRDSSRTLASFQRETEGKPTPRAPWMHTLPRCDINCDSVPMARWMAGAGARRVYQLDRQLAQKSSFDLLAPVQLATFFRAPPPSFLLVNANPFLQPGGSVFRPGPGKIISPSEKIENPREWNENLASKRKKKKGKKRTRGKTETENHRLGSI